MENIAHLYEITNKNTGEYYIGKHRGLTQESRNGNLYWGSGTRIKNQIKKYGVEKLINNELIYAANLKKLITAVELVKQAFFLMLSRLFGGPSRTCTIICCANPFSMSY